MITVPTEKGKTMADREKLIEFIYESDLVCNQTMCEECDYLCSNKCKASMIADYLLSNGVRLEPKQATSDENKRWIPVSERLPEQGQEVIVASYRMIKPVVFTTIFWNKEHDNWYGITNWMPLPEPPKEV